ncbi:MAG: hypothetical protein WC833_06570 [Bacteroidales bacterium]|jgi:hypothetical protein
MVQYCINHPSKWQPVSMNQAQSLTNEGHFVVAGWISPDPNKSGHPQNETKVLVMKEI